MLEEAILEAKAGGIAEKRETFSPQINVDAPILIPDDYVPDLDLRMGLYRRLNEVDEVQGLEAFAAEIVVDSRSEERRVGKECRSRWSPYH